MFRTLKSKILILFGLIIVLSLLVTDYFIINTYKNRKLEEETNRIFTSANIVSNVYKDNINDLLYIRNFTKSYSDVIKSRIIIVDSNRNVIADSHNVLVDSTLKNSEIDNAMINISSSGLYELYGDPVMQISVPVLRTLGAENSIVGAVLIASSYKNIFDDINNLIGTMILISSIGLIISVVLIFLVSDRLTNPIKKLTAAAQRIAEGFLGEEIKVKRKDEVGQLINTFNTMNNRLYIIDENRKRFVQDLSHELKTPLASIRALIDSMIISKACKNVEYLEDVNHEIDRLSNMVNSLLYNLRLGEEHIKFDNYNLSEIVSETANIMNSYAQKNQVEILIQVDKDIFIKCDKDKLKEVVMNLIDNSIKYKDPQKDYTQVIIRGFRNSNKTYIEIEDNGQGILKDHLPFIFHEMYKLDPNRESKTNSYGLGLSIVKKIVFLHGWEIDVESQEGEGTKFIITI